MWKEERPPEVFWKKGFLRNFAKSTGKHGKRPREISKNTFSYRTPPDDCFQSLKSMPDKFQIFSD